jgi:hypothetical protein
MRRISRVTPIACQSSYEISEGWNRDRVVSQAKAFAIAAEGWKTYADVTVKNVGDRVAGAFRILVKLRRSVHRPELAAPIQGRAHARGVMALESMLAAP